MSRIRTIAQTRPSVPQEVVPGVGWSGVGEIVAHAGDAAARSNAGISSTMKQRRNGLPAPDRRKPDISTSRFGAARIQAQPRERRGKSTAECEITTMGHTGKGVVLVCPDGVPR